jgi:uncharacterized protein (DUF433 family)
MIEADHVDLECGDTVVNEFTILPIEIIVSNPKIRRGRPLIAGTAMTVQDIAIDTLHRGYSIDDLITYYPHLNRAQIHAALAYYYAHKPAIDAEIEADAAEYDRAKAEADAKRHTSVL